ncbi:MAG TPA: hypothetical protein VHP63_03345 [candidate division Zixibacteria bacterium]|nr:hypothetical protein [candidate division Zixibacteria bacterium]
MTDPFFKDESKQNSADNQPPSSQEPKPPINDTGFGQNLPPDDRRMASIMAYIPFLCFVPLISMSDNKEVRFHARQGVLLFIIELIAVFFLIDAVSDLFFKGILIIAISFSVAGLIFAIQGKMQKLPIIGDLIDKSKL